ncbi:hypothetical protein LTR56_011240 [Elasticomyces elasticus]|nr:hypothetical protein LTR56_011240 [Elasticomyces elasticus]KAK3668314.1 hypothetical protein LTR22_000605 [Elasticomyces elasticus]KAK4910991.1 hypothetical protein LTR49_020352 [Elasticomyces elasticus]KAK5756465.1 hypothetical protein LTS12_013419 [Elasticomyces elasticus]
MAADSAAQLPAVAQATARLQALLEHARRLKSETAVEPPLPTSELVAEVDALKEGLDKRIVHNTVETAARQIFYSLIHATDISNAEFVHVWNLLDLLILCGEREAAAPELVVACVEELLDSQTTTGCRIVFDYLESRRERLAAKDFHKKNLIFLRSCNELLRRLSRAEDAIFCGRVFFFLFQAFPLGDKSSVNLRGEFHVDNTTKFEVPDGEQMEVDDKPLEDAPKVEAPQPPTKPGAKATPARLAVQKPVEEVILPNNELYPIFWRLQQDFSDPTRLFVKAHFETFKKGLGHTLTKFKKTPTVVQAKAAATNNRGMKRKLGTDDTMDDRNSTAATDHFADKYNPKYLTSRDLFDLELSDLAFQRHITVQALILIDFLLSLTEKAKKKLAALDPSNKSMLYSMTLSAEDTKWCKVTRSAIAEFLKTVPTIEDGRFYHRMVETVLARDKNWIMEARKGAKDATRIRRVPERMANGIDLSFLDEGQGGGLDALRDRKRFAEPSVEVLVEGVKADKLDLEMAMDDAEQESLRNAIASKNWRALRQVRGVNLGLLDKVEVGKDVDEQPLSMTEPEVELEAESVAVEAEIVLNGTPEPMEADSAVDAGVDAAPAGPAVTVT